MTYQEILDLTPSQSRTLISEIPQVMKFTSPVPFSSSGGSQSGGSRMDPATRVKVAHANTMSKTPIKDRRKR